MAFYGSHFSFDSIPCEEFGLVIYDINGNTQGNSGMIASTGEVVEDWLSTKSKSLFYGVKQNKPLSFNMVFGVDMDKGRFDNYPSMEDFLDRWEIARISNWLTGHKSNRKWLEIEQPDMEAVRFFCTITDLSTIQYGWHPWAFSCTVTCDSPYGYMFPITESFSCRSNHNISLYGKQMTNEPYYPKLVISPIEAGNISVVNSTDSDREFLLKNVPSGVKTIVVDNDKGIIETDTGINLYDSFNFKFLRLCPGQNTLSLSGDFDIDIICEFPVNIGG